MFLLKSKVLNIMFGVPADLKSPPLGVPAGDFSNLAGVQIRRDAKWSSKQIIEHHFILGYARIHIPLKTITADKRQLYRLSGLRFLHKTDDFVSQNLLVMTYFLMKPQDSRLSRIVVNDLPDFIPVASAISERIIP